MKWEKNVIQNFEKQHKLIIIPTKYILLYYNNNFIYNIDTFLTITYFVINIIHAISQIFTILK